MGTFAYKDVAYNIQSAFGTSIGVGSVFLPIRTFNMNKNPEATIVEQTTNTLKGFRRAINVRDTVEGDATFYADPYTIGFWMGLAWGGTVSIATVGVSANRYTFAQNTTGNMKTGRFDVDKTGYVEAFQDVFATSFQLTASDGMVEGTISLTGSRQITGVDYTAGSTPARTLSFAEAKLFYSDSTGTAGATMEIPVTNWQLTYNSGAEGAFQSGSDKISRQNTLMPSLELTFDRYYDGSSGPLVARDNVYIEDGERGMILRLTSNDTINGATPFVLEFPMPRVKLMTSERSYEAANMVMESVTAQALYDDSAGYMCEPTLVTYRSQTF